jgi:hypothetical protein
MPAVISIEGGADNGRAFQIEEEVVRVGRAPSSQIVLTDPAAPNTAVAIRYQGSRYVVYNRSTEAITIGGATVGTDQSRPWSQGEAVVAWPGAVLRLAINGDPAPARKVMAVGNRDLGTDKPTTPEVAATTVTETKKGGGAKTGQIAVIVLTWVVIIGALVYSALAPDESGSKEAEARYTKLATDLDAAVAKGNNPLAATTAEKLREARMAEQRGHTAIARKLYGEIVVQLQNRPPVTKPDTKDPLLDRAQEFARGRARSLTTEE